MPALEVVRISERVEAERLLGVRDVDDNGVRGAGGREQVHRRIRRHVVAIARTGWHRRIWRWTGTAGRRRLPAWLDRGAELLALPAGIEAGENARPGNHFGLRGAIEGHPDDVELEERVRRVGRVRAVLAPCQLRIRSRGLLSRHVEVDGPWIFRAGHEGVRVRAFARLHVPDELRGLRVGHVVDSHTGHVVLRILHATVAAIIAVARALGGKEEQVAVDGRITLRCDAPRCRRHHWLGGVGDVPDGEAGKVGLIDEMGTERQVGVDERQPARRVEWCRLFRE